MAQSRGGTAFCDHTPRNLLIATQLAEVFPTALFVLTVRHYSGTIQSLMRLGMITVTHDYEQGRDRQAATAAAAGTVWSRHYAAASQLPPDRTINLGDDRLCSQP